MYENGKGKIERDRPRLPLRGKFRNSFDSRKYDDDTCPRLRYVEWDAKLCAEMEAMGKSQRKAVKLRRVS